MNEKELQIAFGVKLKYWRLKRGFTQEQLANKLSVAAHYISDIETGRRNITLQTIGRLAKALNLDIYLLFNFDV